MAESRGPDMPPQERRRLVREVAGWLAMLGVLIPGLQRFYMGHQRWGWGYLVAGLMVFVPSIPLQILSYGVRALCLLEGLWILTMSNADFDFRFNRELIELEWTSVEGREARDPEQQLESLLKQGLITRAEYEERRRQIRKIS
ncbi:SHOCT domain-containing protein [Synechococcus sp. R5-13]|jgi:TM2 domain-containing membrane protein YozV|uniref:SHOCT domain-containing protein n=1 Tax=Synechococcus sp. R5-13 TaxID=2291953 RepID=UPI0039C0D754